MLKDQLIIITGASRDLGRAMALAVAQYGAIVRAAAPIPRRRCGGTLWIPIPCLLTAAVL
jgi:NAD(P)-dependent dehydrogenase (short-subunit alcohol dehydrogenase family)